MKSLQQLRAATWAWFLVALALGAYALVANRALFMLVSLSVLATVALLGSRFRIAFWPVGLATNLVCGYGMYVWSWMRGLDGLTESRARTFFVGWLAVWALAAMARLSMAKWQVAEERVGIAAVRDVLLVSVPMVLVCLVLLRTGSDPGRVISGHMGGGDHGAHNLIIHRLINPTSVSELVSPMSVYAYPRAVHYLVALCTVFDATVVRTPGIAAEYLGAAQFEYLQLAAFCQLSLVILMGRNSRVARAFVALAAVLFVMSIDSYVSHAFWSGFTTSLAVTWVLMLPLAAAFASDFRLMSTRRVRMAAWTLLSVLCWVLYQPFAAVAFFGALAEIMDVSGNAGWETGRTSVRHWVISSVAFFGPFVVVLAPLVLSGKESPAVRSLITPGALNRPHFWTVVFLTLLAILLLHKRGFGARLPAGTVLLGLAGLAIGSMVVVRVAGEFGFFDQPYYVQKIFWVLIFLSLPVVLSLVLDEVDSMMTRTEVPQVMGTFILVTAFVLAPLAVSRTPAAATRHSSVDWFAKAVIQVPRINQSRAIAFYAIDPLGSHLANLALESRTSTHLPIGTSLSGNGFMACRFANREAVNVIYTGEFGLSLLAEAGCRLDREFVVNGVVAPLPEPPYSDIEANVEYPVGSKDLGQFLLFRGVKSVQRWGAELTGYLSAIGIKVPPGISRPAIEIVYRPSDSGPSDPHVTFGIGGSPVVTEPLYGFDWRSVRIPLGAAASGKKLEVTADCAWSDEEAAVLVKDKKPDACLDVRSVRLVSLRADGQ